MTTVASHYESLLAPIYVWMAGGIDHALKLGADDVADHLGSGGYAVDLGAGFGMHTVPLARSGYRVLAIDTSEHLLAELKTQCAGLDINAVTADMLRFAEHMSAKANLILCMGDTLTHLESMEQIEELMCAVAGSLLPGGRFVATFRDYRALPTGTSRFIPVRSDSDRIHTCFLEELRQHVVVYDIVHQRAGSSWTTKASSYLKLRLSTEALIAAAKRAGMTCNIGPGPRGMLKLTGSAA